MSNDTQTMTLTEFLTARIAEDEEQANRSKADNALNPNLRIPASWIEGLANRVLAECEAKRRIVEQLERNVRDVPQGWIDRILQQLAAVYSDHPDFDPEWRP